MKHSTKNNDLTLFIDILADIICCYLQAEKDSTEINKLIPESQPNAA
ncbi:hypothetical protein [Paenibacillus sp. OK003]|nr:hypothetical protein [Paenibacillus sp. OK003]SEL78559.1 hypothetical protein SAMN05518856_11867 [Paenibacillus sp. OK003]